VADSCIGPKTMVQNMLQAKRLPCKCQVKIKIVEVGWATRARRLMDDPAALHRRHAVVKAKVLGTLAVVQTWGTHLFPQPAQLKVLMLSNAFSPWTWQRQRWLLWRGSPALREAPLGAAASLNPLWQPR